MCYPKIWSKRVKAHKPLPKVTPGEALVVGWLGFFAICLLAFLIDIHRAQLAQQQAVVKEEAWKKLDAVLASEFTDSSADQAIVAVIGTKIGPEKHIRPLLNQIWLNKGVQDPPTVRRRIDAINHVMASLGTYNSLVDKELFCRTRQMLCKQ